MQHLFNGKGTLSIVYGPMRSAKSGELIKFCSDAEEYQHKKVLVFKPDIDSRFSETEVVSRVGTRLPAVNIPTDLKPVIAELREKGTIAEQNILDKDIIAFDEVQFYSDEIVDIVYYLLKHKKDVICAGLNLDYTGRPIGSVSRLLLMADNPIQKHAYCACCGEPALYTQYLESGSPVTELKDTNVVVGEVQYEPRCRNCFVHK